MLDNVVLIFHVLTCLFLILIVLMQPSKSDGMGAFGGGAGNSSSIFGGAGASPFLRKLTTLTAFFFMLNSMALAYLSTQSESVFADEIKQMKAEQQQKKTQPAPAAAGMGTTSEKAADTAASDKAETAPAAKEEVKPAAAETEAAKKENTEEAASETAPAEPAKEEPKAVDTATDKVDPATPDSQAK